MLAPAWSYARYRLALYLYQQEQVVETLELTSGHAGESVELMEIHARALLRAKSCVL